MIFLFSHSQETGGRFFDGYIVPEESGDTLFGLVANDGNKVGFCVSKFGGVISYKPKEILAMGLEGSDFRWHCFEVVQNSFPELRCGFLEVIIGGEISLMQFEGKGIYNTKKYTNFYLNRKGTEEIIHVHRDKFSFRREMGYYFQECPELAQQIRDKALEIGDIMEMVQRFNSFWSKK